ncbi:MAG: NAD-binding protein [Clostridiales bacterium]|nr:NAD-binding protein [Candidatus Blautia equi]
MKEAKKEPSGSAFKSFLSFLKKIHLPAILGILAFYLLCVYAIWFLEYAKTTDTSYSRVVLWSTIAVFGQDMQDHFPETITGQLLVLVLMLFSMFGVSAVTGYISSAFVEHKMDPRRGINKVKKLENHIVICGMKDNLKKLIQDILRKNHLLSLTDIVLINNADELRMQALLEDPDLKGIHYIRGDFTEEQTLLDGNIRRAARALILGENEEGLDNELVDSRVFVAALMVKELNSTCQICSEVRTSRYRGYLEAQHCGEVIYAEEFAQYILATSTNYAGMSKVLSALIDNGDGVSVQIEPVEEKWFGKTFGEAGAYYKKTSGIMVLGVLENMGAEKSLKQSIIREAQKSASYGEVISRLKEVKGLEMNLPRLNPKDDFVLGKDMGFIILGQEVEG